MPAYDYRCRTCGTRFTVQRSMTDPAMATCPAGHPDVSRVWTAVAVTGRAASAGVAPLPASGGGGGCCGGACGCG